MPTPEEMRTEKMLPDETLPEQIAYDQMLYEHEIPGGAAWSMPVRAGRELRLTAQQADACLSTLIIAGDKLDRLNLPDTLKSQMSACVAPPMVLMSDRGRALVSVTGSSLDWHDALTGIGHDAHLDRFGPSNYQADRNDWRCSAYTGLLSELTKNGLGESDLHGCVNFFTKIAIADDDQCRLSYEGEHCQAGDTVTLRTEQDVLFFFAAGMHPFDPATDYAPAAVLVQVFPAAPVTADDPCRLWRAESARALEQTAKAFA